MRFSALVLLLVLPTPALSQPTVSELRASAEQRVTDGQLAESARHLALADAQRKLWSAASARLESRADVKELRLPPPEVAAFTAVLLETEEEPRGAERPGESVQRVAVRARMHDEELVTRMAALHKDQDAAFELLRAWQHLQHLQDGRLFAARLLAAKASAALAKTETARIGGRTSSSDGRQRARRLVDEALVLAPDLPDAHFVLGDLLVDAQQAEPAEAAYRKGLSLQPTSSDGHRRLAEALRLQGKLDEAATELRDTLRLEPASARAHSDLALVLSGQRDDAAAVAEYREAIRLDADLSDAHQGLGIALAALKRDTDAASAFREMIRIDPDSAIGYYNLATALANLDQDVEAAAALREVIRISPNHYNAHYNIGELFRLEGKYDEAAKQFREFLRLAPGDTPGGRRNIERAKRLVAQFEDP